MTKVRPQSLEESEPADFIPGMAQPRHYRSCHLDVIGGGKQRAVIGQPPKFIDPLRRHKRQRTYHAGPDAALQQKIENGDCRDEESIDSRQQREHHPSSERERVPPSGICGHPLNAHPDCHGDEQYQRGFEPSGDRRPQGKAQGEEQRPRQRLALSKPAPKILAEQPQGAEGEENVQQHGKEIHTIPVAHPKRGHDRKHIKEIGVTFHALALVEDQSLAARQVFRVAIGDEGIVQSPLAHGFAFWKGNTTQRLNDRAGEQHQ